MSARLRKNRGTRAIIIALALWLGGELTSHAAALRAEFNALAPRPRTGAPTPLEIKLHWQGSGLLEGVLELSLLGNDMPILQMRTQELAFTAGTQTLRLLLPPRADRHYTPNTEAHLRFLGKKGAVDLGSFPVSNSSYGTRSILIGVCGASPGPSDESPRLWQMMRPERFMTEGVPSTTKVVTSPMMMDAADLPASPLALCAFDLVVLEGDSFARLREKQLAALARWVEGGGSLCVIAGGVLSEEHLRFLNQLTGAPAFTLDERERLVPPGGGMEMIRAELGRLLVAAEAPQTSKDASASRWTEAAVFLSRLPPSSRPFHPTDISVTRHSDITGNQFARPSWETENVERQRHDAIQGYLNGLLPPSTRLIPIPVVAAILGAFVLIIGPGDWFVLGWIKSRRWTWFTLPIVAAAFTALSMKAAAHYLGAEDFRTRLVIIDVGRGGHVLRESRLELLFTARDKDAATDLRQSLAVPTAFRRRAYQLEQAVNERPIYEGQFPTRSILRQRLKQWTPQVNRLLTFETGPDDSGIGWDAISGKELAANGNATGKFMERAGAADFTCMIIHQGQQKDPVARSESDLRFMRALSILPNNGGRWSEPAKAPGGDADLSDLALIAHDDPNAYLAIATRRLPGEVRIYRRIYRTDE